jgi:hypothetical protein
MVACLLLAPAPFDAGDDDVVEDVTKPNSSPSAAVRFCGSGKWSGSLIAVTVSVPTYESTSK